MRSRTLFATFSCLVGLVACTSSGVDEDVDEAEGASSSQATGFKSASVECDSEPGRALESFEHWRDYSITLRLAPGTAAVMTTHGPMTITTTGRDAPDAHFVSDQWTRDIYLGNTSKAEKRYRIAITKAPNAGDHIFSMDCRTVASADARADGDRAMCLAGQACTTGSGATATCSGERYLNLIAESGERALGVCE